MSERIAYQFNGDHVLKFAGMQKLTGEQVADELNRLYTIIAEQNEKNAALERENAKLRGYIAAAANRAGLAWHQGNTGSAVFWRTVLYPD